ncbi:MAG TPA: SusC/RagA family TonB-linked outer membrane protein, partial [Saprospiraceae bacterium]|nr:SusC/RagA family TonB-linked outer membrane protein [Saprospiraceae bacterium]
MKLRVNYFSQGLLLVAFMLLGTWAMAQRTISGTVTDAATKEPLIGANVLVVGTSAGTITDIDGTYSVSVPAGATELEFSYTGYASQKVAIGASSKVDVSLSAGRLLDEVVVVGYGTVRKGDATGAVVAISDKDFNKGVIASPEQLLQGRAAGVQITAASGEPGAGVNIRIRGTSSVRAGNNPLFVVDGVPLDGRDDSAGGTDFGAGSSSARNPLNFLSPEDIETMTVLKDASAAAIYGSRGANGVVLITTKKGKVGTSNATFSAQTSVSNVLKRYDLLSADEYVDAAVKAGANAQAVNFGGATDWQEEIFRTGIAQNYNFSYGGGNQKTLYRFSLGYLDQEGVVENTALRRLSGRLNASHKMLNDKLEFSVQMTASRLNNDYAPITNNAGFEGSLIGAALQANPTRRAVNADGTFPQSVDFRNPLALLAYIDDHGTTSRVLANIGATWHIASGLSYKLNVGVDNAESVRRTGISPKLAFNDIQGQGRAIVDNRYLS